MAKPFSQKDSNSPPTSYLTHHTSYLNMWQEKNQKLQATFQFKNFREAFAFMTEVAMIAEKMDHHPEWTNVWNRVDIQLSTHSAGNIVTEKDRVLASAIDEVFTKYSF